MFSRKMPGEAEEAEEERGEREIFPNEKAFLTGKNPVSWLPLTVFLVTLDNFEPRMKQPCFLRGEPELALTKVVI
jgi:hypothetical protein